MKTYVAILAAGKGLRMGLSQPKQFEMLDGKTVLEHSVDTFEKHPNIAGIFVVVHDDFLDNTRRLLNVRNRPKILGVIAGGLERMDSSRNAILALENHVGAGFARPSSAGTINANEGGQTPPLHTNCNLLIHDAARPFISERIITDVVDALKTHTAVSVAVPATDTVYICTDALRQAQGPSVPAGVSAPLNDRVIQSSPKRETVYLAQTPQGGRLAVLRRAFENVHPRPCGTPPPAGDIRTSAQTVNDGRSLSPAGGGQGGGIGTIATDDATLILNHLPNEKIHIVLGDVANRKITFRGDLG